MRTVTLLLFVFVPLSAQPDIQTVIERSLETADQNWKVARQYTFIERGETRQLDSDHKVKERKIRTFDITLLEGTPYRRLIARDDKPLPPEEERKEEERLRQSIAERRRETAAQRNKRLADYDARRKREFDLMREIPKAFDFRPAGTATIGDAETWVFDATPHPGYKGFNRQTRLFPKFKGRIWIAQRDYAWVRVEAEVVDSISFGLFLARLAKGSHLIFEQQKINSEVWLPCRISAEVSARLIFLKQYNIEVENTYRNYRKFSAESRVVSTEPVR